jgi:uncharacterized protein (UPF0335 family)
MMENEIGGKVAKNLSSHGEGHNSGMTDGAALKRFVDRLVSLTDDRKALNEDFKLVYEEAKEAGFVTKHLRQLVRETMMDPEVLSDHLAGMESLRHALGQLSDTPLGNAAKSGLRKRDGQTDLEDAIQGTA